MCNDVKRQNTCRVSKISEKNSVVFYQDMKHSWGRDKYIECCTRRKEEEEEEEKGYLGCKQQFGNSEDL
jgi:hypothetical protein